MQFRSVCLCSCTLWSPGLCESILLALVCLRLLVASLLKEASSSKSLLFTTTSLYFLLIFSRAVVSFHDLLSLNCCAAFAFLSLTVTTSLNSNKLVYEICKDLQRFIGPAVWASPLLNSHCKLLISVTVYWPRVTNMETGLFLKTNIATETKKFHHLCLRAWWSTSVDISGKILLFERTTELDHYSEGKVTLIKSPTSLLMFSLEIWTIRPSESRSHLETMEEDSVTKWLAVWCTRRLLLALLNSRV